MVIKVPLSGSLRPGSEDLVKRYGEKNIQKINLIVSSEQRDNK